MKNIKTYDQFIKEGMFGGADDTDFYGNHIKSKKQKRQEPYFYEIADKALEFLQKKYKKLKDYELGAIGPGDKKTYINIGLIHSTNSRKEELHWEAYYDRNNNIIKVEDVGAASAYFIENN